ncbi:hypothetical protein [Arthrobacter oryzae]|uniref:Uncharacterized protein n=1 Tax=Arthrobacter oryzae TaxID=409290 RepID=A0A3N0BUU9_9MICC|nr:hypothetical protein [Arthrobacter oryzae]RNL52743.1 hypothetical protein D7003_13615 [Arthrobacter oryzae]
MELSEYRATFERLSKIVGPQLARNIVDQIDEERTKAKRKEAKQLAKAEQIRAMIRQELAL